jgi:3-deoxy-manno-octulosonate cytidylyltransferase (CMP-KDO synthetase)
MRIIGVIPSRFHSTRFPGKPLTLIHGKTMIRRVYEQCVQSKKLHEVIVATDHAGISEEISAIGGNVCMTSSEHQNGTERCAEVAAKYDFDYLVNIQGDEPYIKPEQIDELVEILNGEIEIGTLAIERPLSSIKGDPNRIKLVVNNQKEAMYFSRNDIPYNRAADDDVKVLHHIGMYAYRKDILLKIARLPPSQLELVESLEQLRWLENGYKIKVAKSIHEHALSIDTPDDLNKIPKNEQT